ncbi:Asp/Glu/hydantoin racemase [Sporomusaceae bacterium BoRhaA]|uniref:AroM family protein n=1 Tax=Pelorhabdus rhamnosifermentans TaxID=2772457 RepID=UPI001C05FD63|nr:AroM family protein [Pelorhabdus rhamnosifermentans]MBU2699521.1 Asp/Glu/hydantoin racemase [Pelorhabdus rhamnosifermentans]
MLAVIRVLTIEQDAVLEQHGQVIWKKFKVPTTSYCIPAQSKGIYDEATKLQAVPKIIETIHQAERKGAKAIFISCAADPALKEARAAFSLPIIGAGSALAAMGLALGERLGILNLVGPTPPGIVSLLGHRLVAEASPQGVANTTDLLAHKEAALVAAKKLLKQGADVILLACTGYSSIGMAQFITDKLECRVVDAVEAGGAVARYVLKDECEVK